MTRYDLATVQVLLAVALAVAARGVQRRHRARAAVRRRAVLGDPPVLTALRAPARRSEVDR